MISVAQMREHVDALLCEHDIIVWIVKRPDRAFALSDPSEVFIPVVRSVISYATALHEIGHVLGRHQDSRRSLVRERWAWAWARRNALIWTPRMDRMSKKILSHLGDGPGSRAGPF